MDTSERIKKARKKAGITQKELAEKTGLSIASIQGYEQGKYCPKFETLKKIANVLNVSCLDLSDSFQGSMETSIKIIEPQKSIDLSHIIHSAHELMDENEKERLINNYEQLNFYGRKKVIEYTEDLTKIPEYWKNNNE